MLHVQGSCAMNPYAVAVALGVVGWIVVIGLAMVAL